MLRSQHTFLLLNNSLRTTHHKLLSAFPIPLGLSFDEAIIVAYMNI